MPYLRLVTLVLLVEVLITALAGLGLYYGFSIFPISLPTATGGAADSQAGGITATLPMYMPSLSDLKVPYTFLPSAKQEWGVAALFVSAALLGLQSFVRGMYLGGIKGWVLGRSAVPLIACGRMYFQAMMAWSVFQAVTGLLTLALSVIFIPLGFIIILILFLYSLTPYLIVLQDLSFGEALAKAPRVFRQSFRKLLPLALLAILCTFMISFTKLLPSVFGYAVPLLTYALVGTWLLIELMGQLKTHLRLAREEVPRLPLKAIDTKRAAVFLWVLLLAGSPVAGGLAAFGQHLNAFHLAEKNQYSGVSFFNSLSDVFYSTEQQYTTYEWRAGDYHISMNIPDLSGKRDELRGTANIRWRVNQEVRSVNGNIAHTNVEPVTMNSRLVYRLEREIAKDGSVYYSSLNGFASIIPAGGHSREPLSVQMMVSGDGSSIYVLQHPTRFDASRVFRVSENGKYFIPQTNEMNPMDFQTYWFTKEHRPENIFAMLASKNENIDFPAFNGAFEALAAAMQEADGRVVVEILEMLRRGNVHVKAPDWDEQEWTRYLRNQYEGADVEQIMKLVTRAGAQSSYMRRELADRSSEKTAVYQIEVHYPKTVLRFHYEESKEDRKPLSVSIEMEDENQ
ncbi:hypothetical protein [Paenibacillus turpanensis]|uniref:hypothetical protein n=1 Tax=Paenibacillus turpanensis TaxID=2689078 RepID=UPI00140CE290|nr:hypothetical protein [Paenibacillus turpanensis]